MGLPGVVGLRAVVVMVGRGTWVLAPHRRPLLVWHDGREGLDVQCPLGDGPDELWRHFLP